MPNVQQKKLNSGALVALAFVAALVGISFLPVNFWIRLVIQLALLALFIYIRRGYIYFFRGASAFKKKGKDSEVVWRNLEKALKAGVDFDRRVSIGSAYIQAGDPKRGIEILESIMHNPKAASFAKTAAITCSMGYWHTDQPEKAISVLEDLMEAGYKDDNLFINLESYYLAIKDTKSAKKLISQNRDGKVENNGLLDNRGWYYIQSGNWAKAKEVYDELIDDRNAKFPEAYLHGAVVSIHENNVSQAIDRLGWGVSKRFSNTCMVKKAYMEQLMTGLENPKTRDAYMAAMDSAAVDVSIGLPFDGFDNVEEFDENDEDAIKPGDKRDAPAKIAHDDSDDTSVNTDVDDDDREPNTDLDEEDEVLYKSVLAENDVDESDIPDTDLDDDDREPNTDLDDEDR